MLLTAKDKGDYSFLSRLSLSDEAALRRYKQEFLERSKDRFRGEFGKGFFSAWADYVEALLKMRMESAKAEASTNEPTAWLSSRGSEQRVEKSPSNEPSDEINSNSSREELSRPLDL